ncbi:hypothetical protein Egran_02331 [Elaphomyces granulatus]|uniref:4a-hydroxytetrahydrobiopterin dehydratase n=1 Tax=Elaphomyces granulatus TaxID=519963 RepID=A0A232M0M5_9EURO|nr:hypothetical protein Egran_02331 [Elaphomyces granulatus]
MSAVFSAGEDEAKMKEELQSLQETGWILDEDCMGIKKTYYFKTYTKVLVTRLLWNVNIEITDRAIAGLSYGHRRTMQVQVSSPENGDRCWSRYGSLGNPLPSWPLVPGYVHGAIL